MPISMAKGDDIRDHRETPQPHGNCHTETTRKQAERRCGPTIPAIYALK
jgi:hypothetical protein